MDGITWNKIISQFPEMSILQSWEWGQFKSNHGWNPEYKIWKNEMGKIIGAALFLLGERKSLGLSTRMVYIPHGPLMKWNDSNIRRMILNDVVDYTKDQNAIFVKMDPQICNFREVETIIENTNLAESHLFLDTLQRSGWIFSSQQIQFRNTCILDVNKSEDDLMAQMKQKTRYNIRVAIKRGVKVRKGTKRDLETLYDLYADTSLRDGFIIRQKKYYLDNWLLFINSGMAIPLVAEKDNEIIAGLFLYFLGKKSWYLYGMSSGTGRDSMPNYLLQWEAIKLSKSLGCDFYDLWGAPDTLSPDDPMWGVYRFKEGFGCRFIETIGAYDYPINKLQYKLFTSILPRIQSVTRVFRRLQLRDEAGA